MTSPSPQPPGWYHAQGDPPGTHRFWDGARWTGGPVPIAPPAYGPQYGTPPGTPYGYAAAPRLAGFWPRVAAALLDGLIVGAPSGIVRAAADSFVPTHVVACTTPFGRRGLCEQPTTTGYLVLVLVSVALGVAGIAYYAYFHGTSGQTIGKRVCGIRVVDQRTGTPIGIGRAIGRWFGSILSAIPCLLGFLWAAWDDKKQTWHDKMVGSVVIQES